MTIPEKNTMNLPWRAYQLALIGLRLVMLALFCLLPNAAQAAELAQPASAAPRGGAEYIIGLGDILSIQVWKENDLTKTTFVRLDGRISLPMVGDVVAAGKSIRELSSYLESEYKKLVTEPSVSVMLAESRSRRYYLIGKVKTPGEYSIDTPLTILQVLARAGGFVEWAKKDRITVIRQEAGREATLAFNYDMYEISPDAGMNFLIAPGDTIIVP